MNFSQLGFGAFQLKIFGLFATAAFVWGVWAWWRGLEKRGQDIDFFAHHFWRWLIGGLFLGRLVAFAFDPSILHRQGIVGLFVFWDGGFDALTFAIGFVGLLLIDMLRHEKNPFRWLDVAVVPFFAALLILDLGAFITGAWYGTMTSLPWAVTYNTFGVDLITPVHPVSLYGFLIHYSLLRWAQARAKKWETSYGRLAAYGGGMWAMVEGFLQLFFRGDPTLTLWNIRVLGVIYIIGGIALFLWARHKYTVPE